MTMPSVEEVLQTLESLGTEQARKTYRRHGVKGPVYGVSYADQKLLAKRLKTDHGLALALWASGNHDARILALSVADPAQATDALLGDWLADLDNYVITDALSGYINKTTLAGVKMNAWMPSDDEWISSVGWNVLGWQAMKDTMLPDSYFERYIQMIERDLHGSKNRTRYAMNNALIAIGMRNALLEGQAIEAATRIGKVIVDHGDTNCKTPEVASYIRHANERKLSKA